MNMPVVLDRLPLPNLRWYTAVSVLLLTFSVYYAGVQVSVNIKWREKFTSHPFMKPANDDNFVEIQSENNAQVALTKSDDKSCPSLNPFWRRDQISHKKEIDAQHVSSSKRYFSTKNNKDDVEVHKSLDEDSWRSKIGNNVTHPLSEFENLDFSPYIIPEVISFMLHEPLCIWTLINMAYCILILLGTTIQRLVFGELRVSEQQHIKDKFWNFVFYKFVFVFGVMNVQAMGEGILWCSWFSVLGFLHLLAQLCKDRFEYLSFSPTTPKRTHFRLLGLLSMILMLATSCLMISIFVAFHAGINTFAFMLAECVLLMIRTLYVITRYSIYLWDISHEGLWEKRGRYIYWTELVFELSDLTVDMVHHIHMLVWANMLLTMASLVICMQLRLLFYQLQHKIKSHKNYLRVVRLIKRYPEVGGVELSAGEDTCAICWEKVEIGRVLDCNHLFHSSCLLAWLHHDLSCPTCRDKLRHPEKDTSESLGILGSFLQNEGEELENDDNEGDTESFPSGATPAGMPGNIGWRYVSWLPSFSVEQSHTQLPRHHQANSQHTATSQLDNLARQVHQMFPDVSYSHILEDLRCTRSIEDTIDNILEHRLMMPPPMFSGDSSSEGGLRADMDSFHHENKNRQFSSRSRPSSLLLVEEETLMKESLSDTDSESSAESGSHLNGGYFSKSADERERALSERKEMMISLARQKFFSKTSNSGSE